MRKEELQELYDEICEDIKTITITHFAKLNPDISRAALYWFINKNPNLLDTRTQKSMQRYYTIIYWKKHKWLEKLI